MSESLEELRARIDGLDASLVRILNERVELAARIGEAKAREDLPVVDPAREEEVLQRSAERNEGPFPGAALRRIFREIISASVRLQRAVSVAFLGPEATFTHQAALEVFGSSADFHAYRTIRDLLRAVESGGVDYGVVPVENSIQGSVYDTLDGLVGAPLRILSEHYLAIEHCLLAGCSREEIRRVYSRDQALGQCQGWLSRNLPEAEQVETQSTARAVEIAAGESGAAAIASRLAAAAFGLAVLERGIQDQRRNHTRFLVVTRPENQPPGDGRGREGKTSLVLSVPDRPGSLREVLQPFDEYGINLSRLESRPSRLRPWDYLFFVEFRGHEDDPTVAGVLAQLRAACPFLQVLGSYPVAPGLDGAGGPADRPR